MNHETAVSKAKDIADRVLAPSARQHDKEGLFSTEAVAALGQAGLLVMLPASSAAPAWGRAAATVTTTLAEADASAAMVYLMHTSATAMILAARPKATVAHNSEKSPPGVSSTLPSAKPARAATSDACLARAETPPACTSRRRNPGSRAPAMRRTTSSPRLRPKGQVLPIRPSILSRRARAGSRSRAPGTVWDCGPMPPHRCRSKTARFHPTPSSRRMARVFRRC